MAIKFKDLNDKLLNDPLTKEELATIKDVELHIDKVIKDVFNGNPIKIELTVANFTQSIDRKNNLGFPEVRRLLMYNELFSRFNQAGWLTKEEFSDYRDTYQQDYLILTGDKWIQKK